MASLTPSNLRPLVWRPLEYSPHTPRIGGVKIILAAKLLTKPENEFGRNRILHKVGVFLANLKPGATFGEVSTALIKMGVHLGYKDDDGNLQDPRGLHIIFMLLNLNNKVRFMVHGYDFIPKDRQNDYCAWRNIKHDGHVKSQLSFHGETVVHPVDRDWAACMMAAAKNLGQPPGDLRSPKNISTFAQEYTPLGTPSRKSGSEYPQTPSRLARRAIFHGGSIGKHTKYGCTPGKTMSPIAESPPPPNMSSPDDFPSLGGGPTSPTHTCRTETNRKSSLGPNRGLGLAPPTFGLAGLSLNDKGFGSSSDPFGGPSKKEPELPKGWKVKNTRR